MSGSTTATTILLTASTIASAYITTAATIITSLVYHYDYYYNFCRCFFVPLCSLAGFGPLGIVLATAKKQDLHQKHAICHHNHYAATLPPFCLLDIFVIVFSLRLFSFPPCDVLSLTLMTGHDH